MDFFFGSFLQLISLASPPHPPHVVFLIVSENLSRHNTRARRKKKKNQQQQAKKKTSTGRNPKNDRVKAVKLSGKAGLRLHVLRLPCDGEKKKIVDEERSYLYVISK
jgi:flagellar biosynthesis component FlhA